MVTVPIQLFGQWVLISAFDSLRPSFCDCVKEPDCLQPVEESLDALGARRSSILNTDGVKKLPGLPNCHRTTKQLPELSAALEMLQQLFSWFSEAAWLIVVGFDIKEAYFPYVDCGVGDKQSDVTFPIFPLRSSPGDYVGVGIGNPPGGGFLPPLQVVSDQPGLALHLPPVKLSVRLKGRIQRVGLEGRYFTGGRRGIGDSSDLFVEQVRILQLVFPTIG